MTGETDGWAGPSTVVPFLLGPAGPHLGRAEDLVAEALRAVAAADGVAWASEAAARYREVLADGEAVLRAVRSHLAEALTLAVKHDAAVRLATQTTLSVSEFREFFSGPTTGPTLDRYHGR